jgi:putative transposase
MIGTMMGVVHLLPGTTQASIAAKGDYDAEGQATMTLSEFDRWFALKISRYNNRIKAPNLKRESWDSLAG